jgi:hypothetical protein
MMLFWVMRIRRVSVRDGLETIIKYCHDVVPLQLPDLVRGRQLSIQGKKNQQRRGWPDYVCWLFIMEV